jgi:hypothetical protein
MCTREQLDNFTLDMDDSDSDSSVAEDDEDHEDTDKDDGDYEDDEESVKKKKKQKVDILFTTAVGLSVDNKAELHAVIETAASKRQFCADFMPHKNLHCLVVRWARKSAFNFAADIFNSNAIVAKEVKLSSPFDLCHIRGWCVTLKGQTFIIQYKRFLECLTQLPEGHLCRNLNAIIDSVYLHVSSKVLPTLTAAAGTPVVPPNKNDMDNKQTKPLSSAKKRKNGMASNEFELLHVHDASSFKQRLTSNTRCLQIALYLMDFIFPPRQ